MILDYIISLGPNNCLPLIQLSINLATFMLLISDQHRQTIHLPDIRNMTILASRVSFRTGDPLRNSKPDAHVSELAFEAYPPDRTLYVVTSIMD